MQEPYVIMTRGFRNVVEGGTATGYQLHIRIPYYRGTFLSLVHSLTLSVDARPVPAERIHIAVGGKEFTHAEMLEADDVRWDFVEPATLRVDAPGGLTPGPHDVELGIVIRKSYLPPEDPERLYDFFGLWKEGVYRTFIEGPTVVKKRMTLVQ